MSEERSNELAGEEIASRYISLQEDLEDLYQNATCGYLSHLADGTIVRINNTALSWMGCTAEEVVMLKKLTDFFDFGGKVFYQTHHFPMLKMHGEIKEVNYNLLSGNGNIPVLVSAKAVHDANGNFVLARATLFDISERKKYERELLRAKEKAENAEKYFRFMAESIPVLVWTMEPDGELDYYSRKFYDCTGKDFGNDAVSREIWAELLHPRDKEKTYEALDHALRNGVEYKVEHRIINKDGGYTWMQSWAIPYRDDDGIISKWFGTTIDVDKEIRDRQAIQKAREQLSLVINTIPAVIVYVNREEQYTLANDYYEEWFGKKPAYIINRTIKDVVGDENYKNLQPRVDRALQGEMVTFDNVMRDKYGRERVYKVTYNPDWHGREVKGFVGHIHDVTEEREFEKVLENKVLERTQALEHSNRELLRSNLDLEQFAFAASHDLKEPLRMISSYTYLIVSRISADNKELQEYADFVTEGVMRMKALIDGLLEYSRIGQEELVFHQVKVNKIVDIVTSHILAEEIREKGASIHTTGLYEVCSSESLLIQLFQNLIGNALKFSRSGYPPVITLSMADEHNMHCFSVSDNGIGIDPAYSTKIFDIYQRLNARTQYPGTGIGLALCKKIVELHDGRIWHEPNEDGGSIFKFTLSDKARSSF